MAEPSCSTTFSVFRKVFTRIKYKKTKKDSKTANGSKRKKDSEASKQPEEGANSNTIPPANASTTWTSEVTISSPLAVARTTSSTLLMAGNTSPVTSAAIRTRDDTRQKNENVVQSMVPTEQAPGDISQGTHGPSKAIADTEGTTAAADKTTESHPKGPKKDKDLGAILEATGAKVAPGGTSVVKDGQEAVPKPKPDPDHDKLWYYEKTPVWNQAVEKWRKLHPKDFDKFKARTANPGTNVTEGGSSDNAGDWLTELKPANKTPRQAAARLKRWQPMFNSLRGIAMAGAAFDPHKIAPIVCASIFGGLDVRP